MQQEQEVTPSNFSAKSLAKTALLPGILPRLQHIAGHLSQFLFMFTQIFGSVGLIDRNHPCLKPENIGRYRFTDIIGLAASNVVFDRKHIPQIVMFFMVVLTVVLSAAIILGLIASTIFTVHNAHAQFFGTPQSFSAGDATKTNINYSKDKDWALLFLFRIFGNTGFFTGPAANSSEGIGNPWFTAIFVGMLKYYSLAMLVVASFMILYILVVTLTESARTGEPFGSRFDGIWAPVRLALSIGLLVPISSGGYNGAQMIAFQSAVWGSNLATNVWYGGLQSMAGKSKSFFSTMMGDPGYRFVRDMFLVNLCVAGLNQASLNSWSSAGVMYRATKADGKLTFSFGPLTSPDFCGQVEIQTSTRASRPSSLADDSWPDKVTDGYYKIAADFLPLPNTVSLAVSNMLQTDNAPVVVKTVVNAVNSLPLVPSLTFPVFGLASVSGSSNIMGTTADYAATKIIGDGKTTVAESAFSKVLNGKTLDSANKEQSPSALVPLWIEKYWEELGVMYKCASDTAQPPVYGYASPPTCSGSSPQKSLFFESTKTAKRKDGDSMPDYKNSITAYNDWVVNSLVSDSQYGWASAGVFYLRISSAMASIGEIVNNPPRVTKLPSNLSKAFSTPDNPSANTQIIKEQCSSILQKINIFGWGKTGQACKKYELSLQVNTFLNGGKDWFKNSVVGNSDAYAMMGGSDFDQAIALAEPETATNLNSDNITGPALSGLAGMAQINSKDLNPLGAIIGWGNAFLQCALVAFIIGLAAHGTGWSELAFSLGTILLLPGFILAYWVPTIPFMHFVFAVIEWMISIIEAVIGMPLWALSLITLEGDGLGQLGMSGVKRLFEIILRPTIIVMSLVVSVIIFTAGVSFFNSALGLYANASDQNNGSDWLTSSITGLGMLFVYMFGIYTLATSCFKLINSIPDNFGRWMGLEGGFGSQIKTGMDDLTNLIVTGAALKSMQSVGKAFGNSKKAIDKSNAENAKEATDAGGPGSGGGAGGGNI